MARLPFIGQMDTPVRIYRMETVLGALNVRTEAPVLVCAVRAALTDNSGTEKVEESVEHVIRSKYTIWRRDGLMGNEKLLLYDGDVEYNVEHVRKLGRSHLEIHVRSTGVVKTPPGI